MPTLCWHAFLADEGRAVFARHWAIAGIRERWSLLAVALGLFAAVIARLVYLFPPKTVRNHVSNIFSKLQVADRSQAIIRAREAGLGR
ncbi:MAG: response regulator transcription factor [Caldilineales bacterium]|nr:response regulator transcription factor [Caldilineales bacterium]